MLDSESCMVIMDWAMKYLSQRYRERMNEFFGKRGRSWHVSVVITKVEVLRLSASFTCSIPAPKFRQRRMLPQWIADS